MSEPLTERQTEILRLVKELTEVSGFPPTRAEIAERMGFRSVNAAEQHLRALERKGAIEISAGSSRGIKVRERGGPKLGRLLELPVIGRVAAGSPILAEEHVQARYQLDPNLFTPRADYLLRVRGLSMRDAGILEGDLLAVVLSAQEFCQAIRQHWGVENSNHYVRDVTLGEDKSRIRTNHHIFAKLRSFALNILRKNKVENVSLELFDNSLNLDNVLNYVGIL